MTDKEEKKQLAEKLLLSLGYLETTGTKEQVQQRRIDTVTFFFDIIEKGNSPLREKEENL